MAKTITNKLVLWSDDNPFLCSADAAEIGIAPGEVPTVLRTPMGNTQDFILAALEPGYMMYKQLFGCLYLKVFD